MTFRRLALASAACAVACGRPAPRAAGPSVVTITATDYAFGVPDTIPAGLTTFRLVNQGKRSEEHTSELQSRQYLVCRLLLEKKKPPRQRHTPDAPPRPQHATIAN